MAPVTAVMSGAALAESAGLKGPFRLVRIKGGTNNRVHRLEARGGRALLKEYCPDPARDRLGAEFAFCRFAWDNGLRCVPEPLALDPAARLGLYAWADGRPVRPEEVDAGLVAQAAEFLKALRALAGCPGAAALPGASDACLSLQDHLACVERRLERLKALPGASASDKEARGFARGDLSEAWAAVRARVVEGAARLGLGLGEPVGQAQRMASPSDFGFHNALRGKDGRLVFIDFEYAGWDDAAKAVCDFMALGQVPVPEGLGWELARAAAPEALERIRLLLPVHRLKWACLLLNEFLDAAEERRRFAGGAAGAAQKRRQLARARRALREMDPNG